MRACQTQIKVKLKYQIAIIYNVVFKQLILFDRSAYTHHKCQMLLMKRGLFQFS